MKASRSLLLLACCALIPLLNFPRALVSDRALFQRDVNTVWSPQVESVARQIAAGEPPFFDARRAFGQPLFADPRAEILYPPAWIHWVLPPNRSYALFCALHLILAAFGAARLTRRMAPDLAPEGPFVAAFAYGAGGPMLSLVSHWHHLAAAAWMPWILAECAPERPDQRVRVVPLALLVALQCLSGSPDYLVLTLGLGLLRVATQEGATRRATLGAGLGAGLGLLLSAAQWLPSLAFAHDAAREALPVGLALSPLHPALTLETLVPIRVLGWPLAPTAVASLFGGMQVWMLSHYMGFTVWVLAILGLGRLARAERRFAGGAVLVGLVLAWGVTSAEAQNWIARLPLAGMLRFPTKSLVGASLGLAILAAAAVGRRHQTRTLSLRGPAALAALSLAAVGVLWLWSTGGASAPRPLLLRTTTPIVLAIAALAASRLPKSTGILTLAVAADLLGSQTRLNPTTPASLFRDRPPLSALIPAGARLYTSDYSILPRGASVRPPAGVPYALARVPIGYSPAEGVALAATWYLAPPIAGRFGYSGSFDLDVLDFYRAPLKNSILDFVTSRDAAYILDRLRRGSVDFVVTMDPPGLWRDLVPVAEETRFFADTVRLYRVPGTWPRVRFETADGRLDTDAGSLLVRERTDGRLRIDASPARATNLVVAVANDRGWRATVDGERAAITDTDLAFIRVALAPGAHRVEITYRPPFLGAGLAISSLALVALALVSRRRAA